MGPRSFPGSARGRETVCRPGRERDRRAKQQDQAPDRPMDGDSRSRETQLLEPDGVRVIGGVAVLGSDKPAVTTATDGSFTVADVGSVYDVTLIFSTEKAGIVYRGVSRRDPVLSYVEVVAPTKGATISGNVPALPTGLPEPAPAPAKENPPP